MGDHDLLEYFTFGLQALNDESLSDTACREDHDQQNLSEKIT